MPSAPMFLPEAGLHLATTFLLLVLWALLRRRPGDIGRIVDAALTTVVVGSYLWVVFAFFTRGIDWRLRGYEIERAIDPRIGSQLSTFVVLAFWLLLSSPLAAHGVCTRRGDTTGSSWLALPLECPRALWRCVRRAMHGLALSVLSLCLIVAPFGFLSVPEFVHRFLYRVLDTPISAVNWLLPGALQSEYAFQFLRSAHGNTDPTRYVLLGTATWAALIWLVERLLGRAIALRRSRRGSDAARGRNQSASGAGIA